MRNETIDIILYNYLYAWFAGLTPIRCASAKHSYPVIHITTISRRRMATILWYFDFTIKYRRLYTSQQPGQWPWHHWSRGVGCALCEMRQSSCSETMTRCTPCDNNNDININSMAAIFWHDLFTRIYFDFVIEIFRFNVRCRHQHRKASRINTQCLLARLSPRCSTALHSVRSFRDVTPTISYRSLLTYFSALEVESAW